MQTHAQTHIQRERDFFLYISARSNAVWVSGSVCIVTLPAKPGNRRQTPFVCISLWWPPASVKNETSASVSFVAKETSPNDRERAVVSGTKKR